MAIEQRLPAIYAESFFATAGGLISYAWRLNLVRHESLYYLQVTPAL
jgi:hypothetical protein